MYCGANIKKSERHPCKISPSISPVSFWPIPPSFWPSPAPAPNILAVIGTSMSVGRQSGISLALGVASGSFTWALLTVFGLSAILATYASALLLIKIFGGLYLLWLAYRSFKSAALKHDIEARELAGGRRTPFGYFQRGYIIQMTNPKAGLAWIAIISLGLQESAPLVGWICHCRRNLHHVGCNSCPLCRGIFYSGNGTPLRFGASDHSRCSRNLFRLCRSAPANQPELNDHEFYRFCRTKPK